MRRVINVEKIYDKLKKELSIRFPTGLFCILVAIYFLYPETEIEKLLATYFQPNTIVQIETGVLVFNRVLRYLCIYGSVCVIGLRSISAVIKKVVHGSCHVSNTLQNLADEFDGLLCAFLPAFVASVMLVLISVHSESLIWSPVNIIVSILFVLMYITMWVEHVAKMSQYK